MENNKALHDIIKKNKLFHLILLMETNKTPYGQITVNVQLHDGIALIDSINIVKTRRKKYKSLTNTK